VTTIRKRRRLAALIVALAAVSSVDAADWLWVTGRVADGNLQASYERVAEQMAAVYRTMGHRVTVVAEADLPPLAGLPADRVVAFAGPWQAFAAPSVLGLPISDVTSSSAVVDGTTLTVGEAGLFLRNGASTRLLYTGTTLTGFGEVFKVPTGRRACTVTRERAVLWEGDYDGEGRLRLQAQQFLPRLPDEAGGPVDDEGLVVAASDDGASLTDAFRAWLDALTTHARVLFVGETHWSQGGEALFATLVDHLTATGRLRTVVLEEPFSASRFFDFYVNLEEADRARMFRDECLVDYVTYEPTFALLEQLRRWNVTHPDKTVRVACTDLEWSRTAVVRQVVVPYFQGIVPAFQVDESVLRDDGRFTRWVGELDELLARARSKNLVNGRLKFLTPLYVGQVLNNLRDTVTLDRSRFNEQRQRAILRNLGQYHHKRLEAPFILCKGGSWHAVRDGADDGAGQRDAAFLHHTCPATKGGVVTVKLATLGYRFAPVAVEDGTRKRGADQYASFVASFRRALAEGRAERNGCYMLNPLDEHDRRAVGWARRQGVNVVALTVQGDDWDGRVVILRSDLAVTAKRR